MKRVRIKITGRVTGVFFRSFVKRKAAEANINGWVKNTKDGKVAVVAEGREKDLNYFLLEIKKGPHGSRVDYLSLSWEEPKGEKEFIIVR